MPMKASKWYLGWALKKKAAIMAVIFSLFLVFANIPCVNALQYNSPDTTSQIDVSIEDAYYDDLDKDLKEDDAYVLLRFELADSPYYEFHYIITLELPSGIEYSYLVYVYAWIDVVYINNFFYDHVTESGNYTVYVTATMVIPSFATDSGYYVFDPPGGSEGGKPTFGVS
ncbi:MAG: hypothetical protein ACQET3_06165 [Promethearchaeati archaeon]